MNITVEQVLQPTAEVHDVVGELNDVLGAAYEAHQRHGLAIEQLFEPNIRAVELPRGRLRAASEF